ncbi:MAG: PD40 domain-containing protein [Anaerolineae bacterium]|nr:PD40 domain-containing protein [Anaerolineae bacterium]
MSNPQANPQLDELLREGIQAARAGDKTLARDLLEQVVEQDQHNEKAWFWLAAVVDSIDEKRICLGNVIVINPGNQRAQRLLDQLEGQEGKSSFSSGGMTGGVSRRMVRLAIGLGAAALVALVALLIVVLAGSGDNKQDKPADSSPVAGAAETEEVAIVPDDTQPADTVQATRRATFPPTATETSPPTALPPTWTPVPSPTPRDTSPATPLASPPVELGGKIIMRAGQVVGDEDNQPIIVISPDGTNPLMIAPEIERGHTPIFSPDGSQFAYIKFATGTREVILQINNLEGTAPKWSSVRWGGVPILSKQDMPAWSPDGAWIAFTAVGPGAEWPDLYRVSMLGEDGNPEALERLTEDDTIERWPAFSPDGQLIVYAADLTPLGEDITELRLYHVEDSQITDLTTNGASLIEAAPDWSPDGQHIVFHAQEAGATESDIYWMPANGASPAEKIIDSDASDIQPRFSPDGQYIVFSSDRTGNWDVFVYKIATQVLYQVTTNPRIDIANDWGP